MITIRISKLLEDWWIDDETARTLSDKEILELIHEDLIALLDGATFEVVRHDIHPS